MEQSNVIRVVKKRWLILALFSIYSGSNAFQYITLGIINNIATRFYGVSVAAINWFALIYMVAYILFIIPVTWLLDHKGLRLIALCGSGLNALGATIQVFSAKPNLFWLAMIGQGINGTAQVFILGMPSKVAATWFESKMVSTAAAVCVFGNQIGLGIGFLLPPIIVPDVDDLGEIEVALRYLYLGTALFTITLFVIVVFMFDERPISPPSAAQNMFLQGKFEGSNDSYKDSIKHLLTFTPSFLLILTYGNVVGAFYAIATLLNPEVLSYFPDAVKQAGQIGLTMIIAGIVGSILGGILLDKTKAYQQTARAIYGLSFLSMALYTGMLAVGQIWVVFLAIAILGFFMTGYLPIGFEYAAEITYPICEGSSSGLLNLSAQIFGIFFTVVMSQLFETSIGVLGANIFVTVLLFFGLAVTCLIKADLKRHQANCQQSSEVFENKLTTVTSFSNHKMNDEKKNGLQL